MNDIQLEDIRKKVKKHLDKNRTAIQSVLCIVPQHLPCVMMLI